MVLRTFNVKMNYLLPEKDAVLKDFEIHVIIILIIILTIIISIITTIKAIACLALLEHILLIHFS